MEKKIAHLEMLQGIINRLSQNSFLIKGWSVILVTALFALVIFSANRSYLFLALLPAFAFWLLDGYYLWRASLYRRLYDQTRTLKEEEIDFSMDIAPLLSEKKDWSAFEDCMLFVLTKTPVYVHGAIVAVILAALWLSSITPGVYS